MTPKIMLPQNINRPLFVVTSRSPRLAGLRGTLTITPVGMDVVAQLLQQAARERRLMSWTSYQSTCDVLAALAGLNGVHRFNKETDVRDLPLEEGDQVLIVTIRPESYGKSKHAFGAIDFEFTLCTFNEKSPGRRSGS